MCEILICVRNMGNSGNLLIDSHAPQIGDVIDVHPDGWGWGDCELGAIVQGNPNGNHPFFRVAKLAAVSELQASNMLTPELDIDPQNPSPYLQYRARFLDRTKIAAGVFRTYWDDDARATGFVTLLFTPAQINNIVSVRTPIPFP